MISPKFSKDDIRSFVNEYISPLHNLSHKLRSYGEYLQRKVLGDIFSTPGNLQKIVLGGVQENGEFRNNSLAGFYYNYFGIGLSRDDRVRYMKSATSGLLPKGIVVKSGNQGNKIDYNDKPSLYLFLREIDELTRGILSLSNNKGILVSKTGTDTQNISDEFEKFVANPSLILDSLTEFYNSAIRVLPSHNEFTMFVLSLRALPKDYAVIAYPEIEKGFENLLNDFDLELKSIIDTPSIKDVEFCTYLICKRDGLTDMVVRLIENIYHISYFFINEPNAPLDGVIDEWETFLSNSRNSLDESMDSIAEWVVKSNTQKIKLIFDENGFNISYGDNPLRNAHISAISRSISPLLFSGVLSIVPSYRDIEMTNFLYGWDEFERRQR